MDGSRIIVASFRVSRRTLAALDRLAVECGMPRSTLLNSIVDWFLSLPAEEKQRILRCRGEESGAEA